MMNLDHQSSGMIIALGNLVAMASTWLLMPLLNQWSLQRTGVAVLIYTACTMAATALVSNRTTLFIWGALIGGCISTMGSLSNLFVQSGVNPARRGQLMSALHSLYGLSSFFAPWVAGMILEHPQHWRFLFLSLTPVALIFSVYIYRFGPDMGIQTSDQNRVQPLSLKPIHVLSITVLVSYVVSEVLTSTWLASYLVSEYHLSIKEASWYTSLFFATMLITRVACGVWATPRWHRTLIWLSATASLFCFIVGRLTGWIWFMPLVGLFGPFFPLYVTWVGLRFPERDRSMVIWMLAGMQGALFVVNILMGTMADDYGFSVAFWAPALLMILTLILLKTLEWCDDGINR
jgi:fucose permease